jgi:hypothetical protein
MHIVVFFIYTFTASSAYCIVYTTLNSMNTFTYEHFFNVLKISEINFVHITHISHVDFILELLKSIYVCE